MKPWVALASVQISGFPGIPSISNVGPKTAVKSSSIIITQLECHFLLAQVLVLTMVFGLWLFRIPPFGKQNTITYVTYVAYSPPKGFIWSNLFLISTRVSHLFPVRKSTKKKSLFSLAILLSKTNNKKGNLVAYITEKSRGRNGFGQALIWQICEVTKDVISFHFFTPPSMVVCPFLHGIRILGASTWLYVSSFDNQWEGRGWGRESKQPFVSIASKIFR